MKTIMQQLESARQIINSVGNSIQRDAVNIVWDMARREDEALQDFAKQNDNYILNNAVLLEEVSGFAAILRRDLFRFIIETNESAAKLREIVQRRNNNAANL